MNPNTEKISKLMSSLIGELSKANKTNLQLGLVVLHTLVETLKESRTKDKKPTIEDIKNNN